MKDSGSGPWEFDKLDLSRIGINSIGVAFALVAALAVHFSGGYSGPFAAAVGGATLLLCDLARRAAVQFPLTAQDTASFVRNCKYIGSGLLVTYGPMLAGLLPVGWWAPLVASLLPLALDALTRYRRDNGPSDDFQATPKPPGISLFSLLLLCLTCACLTGCNQVEAGGDVQAIIKGGVKTVQAGDYVTLDASDSQGSGLRYRWQCMTPRDGVEALRVIDGGKKCLPTTRAGNWQIRLTVWNAQGIDDETYDYVAVADCPPVPSPVVPIPTPSPIVNPDHVPVPPAPVVPVPPVVVPEPVKPEPAVTKFGLRADVVQWGNAVQSVDRVAEAQAISAALMQYATGVEGKYKTTGYLLASYIAGDVKKTLSAACGSHLAEWMSAFNGPLGDRLGALVTSGTLLNASDWKFAMIEIGEALQQVKPL